MGSLTRQRLTVEWQHVAGARGTCERCTGTGETLDRIRDELADQVGPGREVAITETILPDEALADSNRVLVNDVPIEELLDDASLETTACTGCGELSACCGPDGAAQCRALVVDGEVHETLNGRLLREAIQAGEARRPS